MEIYTNPRFCINLQQISSMVGLKVIFINFVMQDLMVSIDFILYFYEHQFYIWSIYYMILSMNLKFYQRTFYVGFSALWSLLKKSLGIEILDFFKVLLFCQAFCKCSIFNVRFLWLVSYNLTLLWSFGVHFIFTFCCGKKILFRGSYLD